MKNPFIVRPTGLKGNEKLNRMRELMGGAPLNEDVKNSVVELTKLGPDGKVYGIVREGHNYFIKVTNKTSNILSEDFNYIGGLMNKTSEAYPSYAKAIKQLNLKFMSLNEALGKSGNFNVFEDDNLLTEHHPYKSDQKLSATKGMGDASEYIVDKSGKELSYDAKEGKEKDGFGDNLATKDVEDEFEKVKLSENEMAIENMLNSDEDEIEEFIPQGTYTVSNSGGYEIMLSDSGDAAKVRDAFGSNNPRVSDWLEIEYDENGEPVIDPNGYNIPLNMVMRINENKKSNKFSIESALTKMDSIIGEETTDKVTEILNSLTESEKSTLLNTLKKKV
jgi:hypothetical protein